MTRRLYPSKIGGQSAKEICHEQCTADAESDGRLAGRQHRPDLRPGGRIHQDAPSKSARSPTATPHCRASRVWTRSRPANSRARKSERGEADPDYRLKLGESKVVLPEAKKKKGPRYTPVSRRHERPSAILWLVRSHPELKDSQIMRLVGTTKTTIASVRDRSHWNAAGLTLMDPVTLGLCSQIELDFEVQRAAKEKPRPSNMAARPCCLRRKPPARMPSLSIRRPPRSSATISKSTPCSPS
jgi:hypothetical protein